LIAYILNKALYACLTLLGVITIIFFLFNVLGDPARMMLGQNQTQEQLDAVSKKFGFDLPISKQYLYYLNDLSPVSFHSNTPEDFTNLENKKYKATNLFSVGNTTLVLKAPYLRESFARPGKQVSEVIGETLPNTFV